MLDTLPLFCFIFHRLETEESTDAGPNPSEDLDKLQLRVTMTAQIIFQTFIILMGFQLKDTGIGLVALACGVLAIVQVVLQAIFVETLQKKVCKRIFNKGYKVFQ